LSVYARLLRSNHVPHCRCGRLFPLGNGLETFGMDSVKPKLRAARRLEHKAYITVQCSLIANIAIACVRRLIRAVSADDRDSPIIFGPRRSKGGVFDNSTHPRLSTRQFVTFCRQLSATLTRKPPARACLRGAQALACSRSCECAFLQLLSNFFLNYF
jgi:hypothetical protein